MGYGGYGNIGLKVYPSSSLSKKKDIPKKVHKQKTPLMWGYSAMLETELVLSCLFLVWDNAAPKVMPVRLVLFWVI